MDNSKVMPFLRGKTKGGGVVCGSWLGEPPKFDHIDVELTTDVVVCGGGTAGVCAARAAVEENAETVLLEKTDSLQCRLGDFGTIGSGLAKRWGRSGTEYKKAIVAAFMKDSSYWPKQRIIEYWADHSGETLDWYISAKPDLFILDKTTDPIPDGVEEWVQPARNPGPECFDLKNEYFPCYQITAQFRPDHGPVLRASFDKAMATGHLKAFFKTPARLLIVDGKRVTGVMAQSYDGTVYKINVKKGVVLATGDYSGDLDILNTYTPWLGKNPHIYTAVDPEGYLADTGDGHRMGIWAGGQMEKGPHAPNVHNMGGPLGVAAYLQLDTDGIRFMNEDCSGQQIENQLSRLPGNTSYQFFDGNWAEQLKYMSPGHGCACLAVNDEDIKTHKINHTLSQADGYTSQGAIDDYIAQGKVIKANSLEELVKKLGIPFDAAMASIHRYNELAVMGEDLDFGKTAKRLFPLEKAPFYAAKLTPAPLLVSMSGLESDEYARCLDKDFKPIPGLYVCGNVQGGRFAIEYPTTVPGMSHSMAMTFGRRAGVSAARLL